jgi:peptidoglycan/LPS O-acetylase OafA/YrhL
MNRSRCQTLGGALALFGCFALVASSIAGTVLLGPYSPVADTISDLAAGRYGWIQDTGLVLFALGMLACGVGLFCWPGRGRLWRPAAGLVVLLAVNVMVIATHNEYGDRDTEKYVIHMYAVIAFAVVFAFVPLLLAPGLRTLGRTWSRASIAAAVLWVLLSPAFFFIPTGWDGLYERMLGVIPIGWLVMISWLMLRHGRSDM